MSGTFKLFIPHICGENLSNIFVEGYVKFIVSMVLYSFNPPLALRVPLHNSCQVPLYDNESNCGFFALHS